MNALAHPSYLAAVWVTSAQTGEMCVIDTAKGYSQNLTRPHMWLINSLVPDVGHGLWVYTASADGKILHTSLESGISELVRAARAAFASLARLCGNSDV